MIDSSGEPSSGTPPFVLGIIGDSGSGKNTVAKGVRALLGRDNVADLELGDYHRFTRAERAERGVTALHPTVHNFPLMREHLELLRSARPVRNRGYDHADGTFGPVRTIEPRPVVLVRGLLGFSTDELRAVYDLAVFLQPEAELLFRWKVRRDVRERGYSEAEALKRIARHLLDSKEFVIPQADRADLVVRSTLPHWDAPDSEVRTSLLLRRRAAEAVRDMLVLRDFGDHLRVEEQGDEITLHPSDSLTVAVVQGWARDCFPDTYEPDRLGSYVSDEGERARRVSLVFMQVLIAALTQRLRRAPAAHAPPRSE